MSTDAGRGSTSAAISTAVVGLMHDYTGRGPTQARTSIRDDIVVVLLGDTLLRAERNLARAGKEDLVLRMRQEVQRIMREDLVAVVEQHTGRTVIAFMSDNHFEPDMAAELFVLAPEPNGDQASSEPG